MNEEDRKIQKQLVDEMMKVSKTNPDVMIYMQALMKCYEDLEKELDQSKNNWKELKKWVKENSWYYNTSDGCQWVDQFKILNKMKELEEKNGKN